MIYKLKYNFVVQLLAVLASCRSFEFSKFGSFALTRPIIRLSSGQVIRFLRKQEKEKTPLICATSIELKLKYF